MWIFTGKEDRERQEQFMADQMRKMIAEHEEKRKRRAAWEAGKCPHCGRNDPIPPWLY